MHDYSLRGHTRERYIFILSFIALAIVALANQLAGYFGVAISIATISVFGVVYYIFDKFLWKLPLLSKLIGMPNLNGKWNIKGVSDSIADKTFEWTGQASIEQSWSKIAICVETDNSRSRSGIAVIEKEPALGYRILYGYSNTPKQTSSELLTHHGTCELIISLDMLAADGTYFNDHQRRSCGTMKWSRQTNVRSD